MCRVVSDDSPVGAWLARFRPGNESREPALRWAAGFMLATQRSGRYGRFMSARNSFSMSNYVAVASYSETSEPSAPWAMTLHV